MEMTTSLLVLLMFTGIISIGIGNILMAFASMVAEFKPFRDYQLGVLWLLILLESYLSMFWNCVLLAERETWEFITFLYVIAGPVILLFASSLMTKLLTHDEPGGPEIRMQEEIVITRFFWLFAVSQLWTLGIEFLLGLEWSYASLVSVMVAGIAALLAIFKQRNLRWYFTLAVVSLMVADIYIQSAGIHL